MVQNKTRKRGEENKRRMVGCVTLLKRRQEYSEIMA
jgi:hypothetical protein